MAARRPHPLHFVAAGIFVLLVLSLQLVRAQEHRENAGRRVGIAWAVDGDTPRIHTVIPEGAADRAGLEAGDLITAVDGQPIASITDYDAVSEGFSRGVPVDFEIDRGGARRSIPVSPGGEGPWLNLAIQGVTALACLALGLLTLVQGVGLGDLRARLISAFAFLCAVEMSLPLDLGVPSRPQQVAESLFWLLTGAQIAVELHLAAVVPERRRWLSPRLVAIFYVFGLGFGGLGWATFVGEEMRGFDLFPWSYGHVVTALNQAVLPLWALAVLGILAVPAFRHPEPTRRYQAGLIFVGVLPWGLFVVISAAAPVFGRTVPAVLTDLFPLLVLFFPVAVFIAIYRYHLFDLELVVHRGFLYTALTSALVLGFYFALGAIGMVFSKVVDGEQHSIWAISGAMFFVGLAFGTVRKALQRTIDSWLFPARRAVHQRLVKLAGELPAQGTVANMGSHLLNHLGETFGLQASTLLLSDPQSGIFFRVASSRRDATPEDDALSFLLTPDDPGLERLREAGRPLTADQVLRASPVLAQRLSSVDARLLAPLVHNDRMVGVLVFGPRSTGLPFRREEIEMLSLFAPQIATAFENIRLFESATYEGLTGLLRRESILELLDREIDRAARHGRPLVVGMADLDFFKAVNDRFGHLAGDAVLKKVAEELSAGLRGTDAVGRYGGEEFLLIFPETDLDGGSRVAEKLRRRIEQLHLPLGDGATVNPKISIGLAELPRKSRRHAELGRFLIDAADRALYRAKEQGRNRVEIHDAVESLPGA
ncbi:MAG: diguanylate cyclase [Acidobacteriota bacterium]